LKYFSLLFICILLSLPLISASQTAGDSLIVNDQSNSISHRLFIEPRIKLQSLTRGTIQWNAYHGFTKISEINFLEMAGYPDQSLKARLTLKDARYKLLIGSILLSLGNGVHSLGENDASKQEEGVFKSIGIGVGLIGSYFVVKSLYRLTHNYTPYTVAKQIADDYNTKIDTTYTE